LIPGKTLSYNGFKSPPDFFISSFGFSILLTRWKGGDNNG
jgi:hypothetical protein